MENSNYSSWAAGWTGFAAVMLIIVGVLDFFAGLVALVNDEFYVVGREWVFQFDVTTWGVIQIIIGIVLGLTGIGLFTGNMAARIVAVIVAGLAAIANFAWLPYYPVWAIIVISICVAVIWALTAHGDDLAESMDMV